MFRSKCLITASLLFIACVARAEDFGVADWGAERQTVIDREIRPNRTPIGTDGYLIFEASLPSVEQTRLVYQFEQNRLRQGRFLFQAAKDAPTQAWIQQFEQVERLVSQQYGSPASQNQLTPGTQAAPTTAAQQATALESDQLILKNRWVTDTTEIVQQLAWKESRPHHQVIYRPLEASGTEGESAF